MLLAAKNDHISPLKYLFQNEADMSAKDYRG